MGYLPCRTCGGRGLKADNSGECDGCDGYGILISDNEFRLLPGGGGMDTAVETKVVVEKKPFEYYPPRHLLVRDETLLGWREDLEKKEAELLAEIHKLRGGIIQIDAELERRRASRKARS